MLQSRHTGKLAWQEALVISSNRNAEKQKKKGSIEDKLYLIFVLTEANIIYI